MSEHHSHEHHDHSSHEHIPQDKKILALSFAIITGFMIVEFIGGYWFNSLALMADAGHMANDSLSLFLALLALFLSAQKQRYIALLNSGSLIVVALMILVEAIQRWQNPIEMMALPMLGVASLGLLVNLFVAKIMLNSDHDNLKQRIYMYSPIYLVPLLLYFRVSVPIFWDGYGLTHWQV